MNTQNKIFLVIGSVAVIAAASVGGYALFTTKDAATTASTSSVQSTGSTGIGSSSSTSSSGSSTTTNGSSNSSYKDGTYKASIDYYVPHGTNTLTATIVVSNGIISSVTTSDDYTDHESALYIDSFESGISSAATGKSLNGLSLSRVGGASLTTEAFNSVLDTIRTQATA